MKLLLLGSSQESQHWTEGQPRTQHLLRDMLAAEYGEPTEVIPRAPWPNHRMPGLVEKWVTETDPDTILLIVTHFPYSYRSTPRRIQRLLGERLGNLFLSASLRLADTKRVGHTRPFRALRWFGQAIIGGDTALTPEEAIGNTAEAIRILARRENALIVVIGPLGWNRWGTTRGQLRAAERERLQAHHTIKRLCDGLHITYIGSETPAWANPAARATVSVGANTVGDGIHYNSTGVEAAAREFFDAIKTGMEAQTTA